MIDRWREILHDVTHSHISLDLRLGVGAMIFSEIWKGGLEDVKVGPVPDDVPGPFQNETADVGIDRQGIV